MGPQNWQETNRCAVIREDRRPLSPFKLDGLSKNLTGVYSVPTLCLAAWGTLRPQENKQKNWILFLKQVEISGSWPKGIQQVKQQAFTEIYRVSA
jgi:hypothetical protein